MLSQRHGWFVAVAAVLFCAGIAHAASPIVSPAGSGDEPLDVPTSVAVLGKDLWVADFSNHRIRRITEDGVHVLSWGREGDGPGEFRGPAGIAADRDGYVYVTDFYNQRVQKFTGDGEFVQAWAGPGGKLEPFHGPAGITVDAQGRVYVTDVDDRRVHVFRGDGSWLRTFGTAGYGESGLVEPWGVGTDPSGRVLVTDRATGRVQMYTPEGEWLSGFGGWGDGAGLRGPTAVDADADHVVVADYLNHRVTSFSSDGKNPTSWPETGSFVDVAIGGRGDVFALDAATSRVLRLVHPDAQGQAPAAPGRFQLAILGTQPSHGPTSLRLSLPRPGRVQVEILDVSGRRTRRLLEGALPAGDHALTWDARGDAGRTVSPGIYFVTARFHDGQEQSSIRRRIVVIQ